MRILYAIYWPLPGPGGIGTSLRDLRRRALAAGHSVDLLGHHPDDLTLTTDNGRRIGEQAARDIENANVKTPPSFIRYFEVTRYSYELCAAQLDLGRYDVVHAQDVMAARALRRVLPSGVPLVATIRGSWTVEATLQDFTKAGESLVRYLLRAERVGISRQTACSSRRRRCAGS